MEFLTEYALIASFLLLAALEIMLGIDNVVLVVQFLGFNLPKGYIYFGMAFSLWVATPNLLMRNRRAH